MRAKKLLYLLSVSLLLSGFILRAFASSTASVSFHGVGVTVDLTFPEEAHPAESISHNLTITTYTIVELQNVTLFIYAPVDSTWQFINKSTIILPPLPANTSLPFVIRFTIPQNANGTLYCLLYVQTDQSADYSSYTFYTTQVSNPTFSEMLADYTSLKANYTSLNETYYNLLEDYDNLFEQNATLSEELKNSIADYESLLNDYYRRLDEYNALNSKYETLDSNYKSKLSELGTLQLNYDDLNSTRNSLLTDYEALQALYDELNQTYTGLQEKLDNLQTDFNNSQNAVNTDRIVMFIFVITLVALIAFIIYLKRGKEEPYVVIRKETVSMNQNENS